MMQLSVKEFETELNKTLYKLESLIYNETKVRKARDGRQPGFSIASSQMTQSVRRKF